MDSNFVPYKHKEEEIIYFFSDAVPNPFAGPSVEAKLRSSPKTSAYMNDPSFMTTLRSLQANPNNLMKHMQDSRVMEALGVLLGVDIGSMGSANSGE